ncbi:cytochrome c oxidase assembly protein [Actinospica sp.]|jgi:cytochrome c oxidase assembly factor CtaG|uniref:cytochrome c oxidase assembly protein n=1 Tax=Actinospica sp. TaxID=1872142 RepID=UPI002C16C9D8|nr:cytochrome c oxidase assembly protein [Actinospica sp.]HWG23628.1 cytochrome c oxidase assembly protein [Actinospica sp.]
MASSMPGMPGMPGADTLPPPGVSSYLTWHPEPFFLVVSILVTGLYVFGVLRLRLRGDAWPINRTVSFLVGMLVFLGITCTGLNEYGMYLFSAHMVQHMMLSMVDPLFLLLGAPITLALRVLHPAGPGRTGPREVILALLHSRFAKVVASPLFTLPLFVVSLYGLYFTSLFDFLMRSRVGHDAMLVHFLVVGLLFFWPVMGVDPAPHRSPFVIRILELFAVMPFHAFFGIAIMMSNSLFETAFANPPASWGLTALSDQNTAGSIAWAFGEAPTIIVLLVLFVQWAKSDRREAKRKDRKADRDGDAELNDYNDYLAGLARRNSGSAA